MGYYAIPSALVLMAKGSIAAIKDIAVYGILRDSQ